MRAARCATRQDEFASYDFFAIMLSFSSLTEMNSKPIDLTEVSSSTSWLSTVLSKRRLKLYFWLAFSFLLLAACVLIEFKTSIVQAWIFTRTNERLSYELAPGPASSIAFPPSAPFDDRRGYSKLSGFQSRLLSQGFQVSQQARQSETMVNLISQGISPPYIEPPETGIDIRGAAGVPLFRHAQSEFLFEKIDNIPPLLVKTLLFLEDRDLDSPNFSRQNPAVEWDRFLKAALFYLGSKLYLDVPVQGGSTLAVQLEKFRHSAHGRTDSPLDKFRQIVGASLKAYRAGPNTRPGETESSLIISIPFPSPRRRVMARSTVWARGFTLGSACNWGRLSARSRPRESLSPRCASINMS